MLTCEALWHPTPRTPHHKSINPRSPCKTCEAAVLYDPWVGAVPSCIGPLPFSQQICR